MNIFTTDGRMNRSLYFWTVLPIIVLTSISLNLSIRIADAYYLYGQERLVVLVTLPLMVACFLVYPVAQRFHDIGLSAGLTALLLVPFVNVFALTLLAFWRGEAGANRFGSPPGSNADTAAIEAHPSVSSPVHSQDGASPDASDILEERLAKLQNLFERGLIEESVYREKQANILKDV